MSSDSAPAGKKAGRVPAVLRNGNFARLFLAGVASSSGFAIGQVALTLLVYTKTGAPLDVAYIGVSFIVASVIFSLIAGALVDRNERRKLMVLSDLVRAASLGVLVVTLAAFGFSLYVVLGVAFLLGSFTTLFQPAERALTPELVGSEQIANANALVQTSSSLIQAASNAAGGVMVVAVGVFVALSVNMATFVISALLIVGIAGFRKVPGRNVGTPSAKHPSMIEDIREGFRYIFGYRALLYLTVSAGLGNFFFSMVTQFMVFYAGDLLHGGGDIYGYLLALFTLGFTPGAYLSVRFKTIRVAGKIWIAMGVADGACVLLLVAFPTLFVAMAVIFAMGVFLGVTNNTWLTIVQLIVPTEMQGRYFGLDQLGSFAVVPIGQVLGGVLVATAGVTTDFLVAGVGAAVSSGIFVFSPRLRKLAWTAGTT